MNDRKLLEKAAKAAGVVGFVGQDMSRLYFCTPADPGVPRSEPVIYYWLDDDGDAFRLAVSLGMVLELNIKEGAVHAYTFTTKASTESTGDNPCAATRRAIVRAAATIGAAL